MQATHDGNYLVPIALFGWMPVVFVLFALMPARRAALMAFLGGWMFLPYGGYAIPHFPEYTKVSAICAGILLATLVFDTGRITKFRLHWLDLFPITACVVPFFSSLSNGLGAYDGLSAATGTAISWMFPYLIGRLYFSDFRGMHELIMGLFIAGIIYIPFCLWEIRMSPNLHYHVYGFHQSAFIQTYRGGGYRPMVFMVHGLMLVLFMGFATLAGCGLWMSQARKVLFGAPMWAFLVPLALTTLLCRSIGAIILVLAGFAALLIIKYMRTSLPVVVFACIAVLYVSVRASGLWSGTELVDVTSTVLGSERAASLNVRIVNETVLAERARERLFLGWGGWGRNRIIDEHGQDTSITDGHWIIIFGIRGVIGLVAFMGTLLGPALLFAWRVPGKYWMHPAVAPATLGALILCLWMLDCIPNPMPNPIYLVAAGGMAGLKGLRVVQPGEASIQVRIRAEQAARAAQA